MIVQSFGQVHAIERPALRSIPTSTGDPSWSNDIAENYGDVYAAQPNVRIPVDFLARNVAQLGIHIFRRVSDTDRIRLIDHELARWLAKPNPFTTRFRLIESLLGDLGVFFNAYWLKVRYRDDQDRKAIGLVRLPPDQMYVRGGILPSEFVWTVGGREQPFPVSEVVHFAGYNPLNPRMGLSNLETLGHIVSEEAAAVQHREYYWRNASRHEGVVERPREAPKWSPTQKQQFREQWQQRFAGGINAGLVAVLEDGMQFKPTAFSPKDSEYILGGKLRREISAATWHIPQPSIGILEHATFSNVREQHKQLYQDCLGPTLVMIQEEIVRQLLIECEDQDRVYPEFNIAAKLAGSFEEQAIAVRTLVGKPVMTPNEARARLNLPSIKNDPTADELAPQQGGPSDATAFRGRPDTTTEGDPDATVIDADPVPAKSDALVATTIETTRSRQFAALAKVPPARRSTAFFEQIDRWNRELATDLTPIIGPDAAVRTAIAANVQLFSDLETMEAA